ncbi:MAG: CBS domain-containing protein [Steroidobacteraceae bacterium]
MNVGSYCHHRVITVHPQADLAEAAAHMRSNHVGLLVVVNPGDVRPIGVLTDRDIVVQVVAKNLSPAMITVADAMTRDVVIAHEEEPLTTISQRMRSNGVRRVPVVDDKGALSGIIASDDILDISATILSNLASATHKEQCSERRSKA